MKNKGWPRLAACWPLLIGLFVYLCLRLPSPWVTLNPWFDLIGEAAIAMMVALMMRTRLLTMALLVSVLTPLCGWLLDIFDGPVAVVYGVAILCMAEAYVRTEGLNPMLRAGAGALAASLAVVLGTALVFIIAQEKTPGAALGYSIARQGYPTLAYFAGGLVHYGIRANSQSIAHR